VDQHQNNKADKRMPKICFVALNCYNLISKRDDIAHIGGAEVQQWLMAQWLQEQGYSISFVTHDHGQSLRENISSISVYKAFNKNSGLPVLRFFHPRWSGLWSALNRSKADIFYLRGAGLECGQVAIWCRLNKKKFIFASSSDSDCMRELPFIGKAYARQLYRLGLSLSDSVISQTTSQQNLLKRNYKLDSTVLRNCGERPSSTDNTNIHSNVILWIGRFSPEKRLDWLLEIAEACPEYQFEIVGESNYQSEYAEKLLKKSNQLCNVNINGRVPHSKMNELYSRCKLLCSTSELEGFPNVYIEAWSSGIPVLTSFDPDGVINSSGAGWVQNSVSGFINVLQLIQKDSSYWTAASIASRKYYDAHHRLETNMPILKNIIGQLTIS